MLANGQSGFGTRTARLLTAGAIVATLFAYGCRSADANAAERAVSRRQFRGLAALQVENPDSVIAECTRRIDADSTDIGAYMQRALAYDSKEGGHWKTEADLKRVIRADSGNADAFFHLGFLELGYGDSEKNLTRAIGLDSTYSDAYCRLGWAYESKNKKKALAYYAKAIEVAPDSASLATAYTYRARLRRDMDAIEESYVDFEEALRLGKKEAFVYAEFGYVCLRLKKEDEALALFTRAIETDPKYYTHFSSEGRPFFERGQIYLQRGRFGEAADDFTRFIEMADSTDFFVSDAYQNRSDAYKKMGALEKAGADSVRARIDTNHRHCP